MCLQYKPTVVACFCIYLACKWSRWEIPQSTEGKHWFHYVDETVTMDLLKKLTDEFLIIYEKSPTRLKSKLTSNKALAQGASNQQGQAKTDFNYSNIIDHKHNAGHVKPQQQPPQPYGGCEHSSTSMMAPSNNKSSSSSSSRTSMSNNLPVTPMRQSSSQGHPMDVNYHKSRERNMAVLPPPAQPPHAASYISNTTVSLTQNSKGYTASGYKIPKIKIERDSSKKEKSRADTCELAGTNNMSTIGSGGIKRPNELVTINQEDDLLTHYSKRRKLDTAGGNSDINKHQVMYGIETNTDMVRKILRESLCSTSSLLKTDPFLPQAYSKPAEVFKPSATFFKTKFSY